MVERRTHPMMTLLLILSILVGSPVQAGDGVWNYGPVVTSPTGGTVFVTTGAIPATGSVKSPPTGNYLLGASLYCSVNATYNLIVLDSTMTQKALIPKNCSS